MADDADVSQDRMEVEEKMRRRLTTPQQIPKGNGKCQNCGGLLADDRRWCDRACQEDDLRRTKR